MRLILIDGNEANVDRAVGVSVYTLGVLKEFKKYASHDVRFCVYLRSKPKLHLPRENQYFRYKIVWGPLLWLRFFLPIQLAYDYIRQRIRYRLGLPSIRFHSFFSPAHYAPSWIPPQCKLVVTIHDLAYEFYPDEFLKRDLYKLKNWTLQAVHRASAIISVSEHTKKDIISVYGIASEAITVVLNGFSPPPAIQHKQTALINGHDYHLTPYRYVLYIGTLQPRKNISTLIYAYALFKKEQPDMRLVIAGKKGWLYDDLFALVKKLKLEDSVHFVGFVSDQDKSYLLTKALCCVLPSLYEGFGLPILEAFSASCPVLCSNTSSLPEVAGKAALYFDPKNPNDILDKLRTIEKDLKLRHTCIELGLSQAQKFSWSVCGEETLRVLLK